MSLTAENYESSMVRVGLDPDDDSLWMAERFWDDITPWLESKGYSLPSRKASLQTYDNTEEKPTRDTVVYLVSYKLVRAKYYIHG